MIARLLFGMVGVVLAVSGCAAHPEAPIGGQFGRAAASLQAQAVPPRPDMGPAESSGARGVAAIGRYERGAVKVAPAGPTSEIAAEAAGGEQPVGDTP